MQMSGELQAPVALFQKGQLAVFTGCTSGPFWILRRREISCIFAGNQTTLRQFFSLYFSHCTDRIHRLGFLFYIKKFD